MDDLAELIKRVMTEKDWTLSTLARRSGLSTSTLHSWKSGHRATGSRGPTPDKLRQLAEGAGLPVNQVFEAAGRHVPAPMDDEDERRFLHLFRSLDSADRGVIEATMRAMSERQRADQ
ncbi:helix-turn-helix domain-containing protein [Streptomyces sp. NBC_01591]|uniref:helix-turn-helix domain-containing protein n=1 Tax=Streptomyces sp. NBC_01591 TaxID=2975888 RepID=UPI002DDC59E3|nr:helix-turn-helix transcriptional regulator [Streptomyces sp. NBC_01591]WSD71661.1 helix-turn-helix domain-containing protein [Streptomyces sp. NBC_01591]